MAVESRQIDMHACPFSRFTVHRDFPLIALDNAMHHGEPETGTLVLAFGGEIGLEDPLQGLMIHAATRVADGQPDILASGKRTEWGQA